MKKYAPYVLATLCIGVVYIYFVLSKDVKHLTDNTITVTNHWTGAVKDCLVAPNGTWTCQPADSIPVPWYMEIVQHTVESFN